MYKTWHVISKSLGVVLSMVVTIWAYHIMTIDIGTGRCMLFILYLGHVASLNWSDSKEV